VIVCPSAELRLDSVHAECLKVEGNLPPEKERLARCAMISEKTVLQRMMREVGMMSIVDDLAGEKLYQDANWYGGGPRPKRHHVRWGPSSPLSQKGEQSPSSFRPISIVAKRLYGSR